MTDRKIQSTKNDAAGPMSAADKDAFSDAFKILRGTLTAEDEARIEAAQLARIMGRPSASAVFPPSLNRDDIYQLRTNWVTERMMVEHTLFDGECPACGGSGRALDDSRDATKMIHCPCDALKLIVSRLNALGIPPDLFAATWRDSDPGRWEPGFSEKLKGWMSRAAKPGGPCDMGAPSLVLTGPTGTGKSHIAALLAFSLATQGLSVAWISWVEFSETVARAFKAKQTIRDVYARHIQPFDLVVFDDLGEGDAPWDGDLYEGIIGRRASMRRTMLITSNLSADDLTKEMGARATSRLFRVSRVLPLVRSDLRLEGL